MIKIISLLLMLSVLGLAASFVHAQQSRQNNTWYSISDSDTVFIYVHGIFSNSADCWSSPSGAYWPEILRTDTRFENPSIFLGGYYTDFSSGLYKISDASEELLTHLRVKDVNGNPPPLAKPKLIFIAHSTGGLVVRYLLERNQELFVDKTVGLVLLASPSRGAEWSNRLIWLRKLFGNKMASQLSRDNDFVTDLDLRFADLVSQKKLPRLIGIDAFENKFIIRGILWNSEFVVSATDSASYFGSYKIIPDSDHFSIVKPKTASDPSHHMLWDFYESRFRPLALTEVGVKLKQPRFSEKMEKVTITIGSCSMTQKIERLQKEAFYPLNMGGFKPVKFYVQGDMPYSDVAVYGGSGIPPIEIRHNQLINRPPNWDFNSNEKALEIVDQNNNPLYQLFYKTPYHIVINGIFPFPGGLLLATETGISINPTLPTKFGLKRIFKYPSWKFPGEFDEIVNR